MAGYLHWIEERHNEDESRRYLTEAMRQALEDQDNRYLRWAYTYEGLRHAWNCEFAQGESCIAFMIETSKTVGDVHDLLSGKLFMPHGFMLLMAGSTRP